MTLHKNPGFGYPHSSLVAISFLIPFQISKGGKRGGLNPCIIGLLDCKVIKGCAHHIPEKKFLYFLVMEFHVNLMKQKTTTSNKKANKITTPLPLKNYELKHET